MSEKNELKLKAVTKIKSFGVDSKKVVTIKMQFSYADMVTSVNLLAGLNVDVAVLARVASGAQYNLGVFKNAGTTFDKDGNSIVTLKSMVDNVNVDKISALLSDETEAFQVMFKAVLTNEE